MKADEIENTIRIYVACLAAYNSGYLHGAWIDATQSVDDINRDIQTMLDGSPIERAEEYAIHDYDGFEGARVNEYDSIEQVSALAQLIAEHGAVAARLYDHYGDVETASACLQDHYAGCFDSVADFAEQLTEETSGVPDHLRLYVDYEKMGRDMEINDLLVFETNHQQVHVFWQH